MKNNWIRTTLPIAAVFAVRMLGLFMLIPVLTLYAQNLTNADPQSIGVALGIYGLTQGLFQIPFGLLSDRFGRKPLLIIGLGLFILGSILGAFSRTIETLIIARLLQGAGAIGSVLIALLADLTPDADRTKAMALIGASIGMTFLIAVVISPSLTHTFGLSGLFHIMVILGCIGLFLVYRVIPTPNLASSHKAVAPTSVLFIEVIKNTALLRLNASIFFQHAILTATFYVIPHTLQRFIQEGALHQTWHFYLPVMLGAFILMIPIMRFAEKHKQVKICVMLTIALSGIAQALLAYHMQQWILFIGLMLIYFIAFNFLEATLPSLISRLAPPHAKGTAMGIYSSCQFLGLFCGGVFAGILAAHCSESSILAFNALITLLWLGLVRGIGH